MSRSLRLSLLRIYAIHKRHYYLLRGSWPRIAELFYWPTVQMIMWGFMNQYLMQRPGGELIGTGMLIAAFLLWDILFRSQLGVSLAFFEEIYSRNLGYLFVSPLRPHELVCSLLSIAVLRTLLGVGVAAWLATPFYGFSIFDMGWALVAFFSNLIFFGWAIGLAVVAMVMRYGMGAESLAWALVFIFAPITGVYYPVAILPAWLQPISWSLPPTYVFEGLRELITTHQFNTAHFFYAVLLNAVYLSLSIILFMIAFRIARKHGLLLQIGE
ncbi:MAG: ABC transporter permease [Pseudomonadota bacterium]